MRHLSSSADDSVLLCSAALMKTVSALQVCEFALTISDKSEKKTNNMKGNISVAIGTGTCNHRYTVTIDTKAQLNVTRYSSCAGSSGGRSSVTEVLPEPEAGPEAGEVAVAGGAGGRLAQPEEGVALHRTLPQVFTALGVVKLEHEGVLLLPALQRPEQPQC